MEDLVGHHRQPERRADTVIAVVVDVLPPPDDRPPAVEEEVGREDEYEPRRVQGTDPEHRHEGERVLEAMAPERTVEEPAERLVHRLVFRLGEIVADKMRYEKKFEWIHGILLCKRTIFIVERLYQQ